MLDLDSDFMPISALFSEILSCWKKCTPSLLLLIFFFFEMTNYIHYCPKVVFIPDYLICPAFALNGFPPRAVDVCG